MRGGTLTAGPEIAATNRNLGREVEAGRFREDLCYRLCADRVLTPSLREQLADRPEGLPVADPTEAACRVLAEVVSAVRQGYDGVERRVFAPVHRQAGSWQEAGRLLGRDWRTVKRVVSGSAGEGE